ncbi:hypothetical protein GTQ34_09010 [Muricauda sp. JGD-17]|uniref:SdiA-regulated family protein n=1 Tax=Flagellimonas ochracea TaxID=2696472 RepID=A0A964TDM2_9FLAO|nr:hypothetical protein [Allomuricauda ochracea]NAY92058.1 hypothetical protein [Allomuricauda ochracea]
MSRLAAVLLIMFFQGCAQQAHFGPMLYQGTFPSKLKEVSGMEVGQKSIWVIEDSGTKDKVYRINRKAQITKELKIDNAKNDDWEDLAMDLEGNLYIGDFGNNNNTRKKLTIYKVSRSELKQKEPQAEKIKFRYPEQRDFPPKKDSLLFDTEGFFHWDDSLYVFTKNRTRPYNGQTLVYKIPSKEGEYDAQFLGSLVLCRNQDQCSVTGADISADGKTIALLGYGLVFLITDFDFADLGNSEIMTIDLEHLSQTESISFLNNNTLLIADEENKTNGRNLYKLSIKDYLKSKTKPERKP